MRALVHKDHCHLLWTSQAPLTLDVHFIGQSLKRWMSILMANRAIDEDDYMSCLLHHALLCEKAMSAFISPCYPPPYSCAQVRVQLN